MVSKSSVSEMIIMAESRSEVEELGWTDHDWRGVGIFIVYSLLIEAVLCGDHESEVGVMVSERVPAVGSDGRRAELNVERWSLMTELLLRRCVHQSIETEMALRNGGLEPSLELSENALLFVGGKLRGDIDAEGLGESG